MLVVCAAFMRKTFAARDWRSPATISSLTPFHSLLRLNCRVLPVFLTFALYGLNFPEYLMLTCGFVPWGRKSLRESIRAAIFLPDFAFQLQPYMLFGFKQWRCLRYAEEISFSSAAYSYCLGMYLP